jgi:hypothetical protein
MTRNVLLAVFCLVAAACTGSGGSSSSGGTSGSSGSTGTTGGSTSGGGGSATLSGTLLGASFTPADALSFQDSGQTTVAMTNYANACSYTSVNNNKANSSYLAITFLNGVAVGTFNAPSDIDVQFANLDATCSSPTGESAASGTVTVSKEDNTGVNGTFDLMMGSSTGDHITGSFTAPNCAITNTDGGQGCH